MTDPSGTGLFNEDKLVIVARILMAAATVDGEYDGSEQDVIENVLKAHVDAPRLPRSVLEALVNFDETVFDLQENVRGLGLTLRGEKRLLMQVVTEVFAADTVFHVGEELFFDQLSDLLALDEADIAKLRAGLQKLPAWKD